MKFSLKLLLWTVIVLALALGFSGFYFVNSVFETSMERETGQAMEESRILRFAFETAALNAPAKYDVLADRTIEEIARNLENGGSSRRLRISGENRQTIYGSSDFGGDGVLLAQTGQEENTWQVIRLGEQYFVQTCMATRALDRILYLETMRDVTEVFKERALGFLVYRRVTVLMLVLGTFIMHGISSWLTRPIRLLTRATKRMAEGEYGYRAKKVSDDELGQLTLDFNRMANALEDNIAMLQKEIQAREDFVAAFAHELKTPLTAIIGYADMLRSHRLDEEKRFLSANYIYTEGKRLEAMSFRLLEIMVTRHGDIKLQAVPAEALFQYLSGMYANNRTMRLLFRYDSAMVQAEPNLLKSVMVNLIDNACKASEPGGVIEVRGCLKKKKYRFSVRDYGEGIPKEEQEKVTQAFYMVDKSRSRSRNGAGLGLALCAEILALHGSRLRIDSEIGKGTCMSFILQGNRLEGDGSRNG
ncbi:sensor histidine kinase [Clostridiaceae bacterium]|nr:sensor histidine kinase [Clostridiaceae bacterium]RKI09057.1 sensor histidine kinase [bacterium 1XD21-70]